MKHRRLPGAPCFADRIRLGVEMSKYLDTDCTYEEIGIELGITKQNAYTEVMLALGTLVWLLRRHFGINQKIDDR